ncbi:DUF3231 family protein [Clostridium estertheticum]|uniref:DUF3231 family protein n=1 Tax=Clostridium estertheticum TaxID=238834 RepID=UPI001CF4A129|nr:DUF3231 family protein [Clostridium estertheticum]MCB2340681.1 DUF3231 family protein [Clostridium estertheticum]
MTDIKKILLVSSEISGLWNSYMANSSIICSLKFFVNHVDDNEIRSILQYTLDLANQHNQELEDFFTQASLPIPDGFTDDDVNINAPRLFTDEFYLLYLANLSRAEMLNYTQILSNCARLDIRELFTKLISESTDIYNKVTDIRLSKGVFTRFPSVEVPKKVEYIENQNFMVDWFGEKRPLLVGEITHISLIILANVLGRAIITGFGQVSKRKEIVQYMFRGRDISSKKIDLFTSILTNENIPIPSTSYSFVTDSTVAPYSEKLMMFKIIALGTISIINDGMALAESLRTDLQVKFIRITPEVLKFIKDGSDIMIENKWLEQPPQCIDHKNLAGV